MVNAYEIRECWGSNGRAPLLAIVAAVTAVDAVVTYLQGEGWEARETHDGMIADADAPRAVACAFALGINATDVAAYASRADDPGEPRVYCSSRAARALLLAIDAGPYHSRALRSLSALQRRKAADFASFGYLRRMPRRGRFPARYVLTSQGSHAIGTFLACSDVSLRLEWRLMQARRAERAA